MKAACFAVVASMLFMHSSYAISSVSNSSDIYDARTPHARPPAPNDIRRPVQIPYEDSLIRIIPHPDMRTPSGSPPGVHPFISQKSFKNGRNLSN